MARRRASLAPCCAAMARTARRHASPCAGGAGTAGTARQRTSPRAGGVVTASGDASPSRWCRGDGGYGATTRFPHSLRRGNVGDGAATRFPLRWRRGNGREGMTTSGAARQRASLAPCGAAATSTAALDGPTCGLRATRLRRRGATAVSAVCARRNVDGVVRRPASWRTRRRDEVRRPCAATSEKEHDGRPCGLRATRRRRRRATARRDGLLVARHQGRGVTAVPARVMLDFRVFMCGQGDVFLFMCNVMFTFLR